MGRDARRRSTLLPITLLAALMMAASPASVSAAKEKGTTLAKAPKLAETGKAAFWDCPSKTTLLLVVVNTLTLHPGDTLDVSFTVRNGATTSCNYTAPYAGVAPGPTSTTLTAGPCGSVDFRIDDAHHHNVWPGNEVVNCPALGFAQLAAGATVSGTGAWDQTRPNSTHRVAPGNYTLVVGSKHFSFPIHIARS
jgi:hypothetical protein